MKERRKFARFKSYMDASYELLGSRPLKVKARLKDVSKEGIRLSCESALLKGSHVDIMIKIPGQDKAIKAFGRVVSSKRLNKAYYDTNMSLTKVRSHEMARLLDYAYDEWLKTHEPQLQTAFA
jgi:hypothetical protein